MSIWGRRGRRGDMAAVLRGVAGGADRVPGQRAVQRAGRELGGRRRGRGRTADDALGQRIQVASTQADSVASVLGAGARELRGAQKQLNDAIGDADGIHLRVGDDGSLSLPEMSAADWRDPESIRYWGLLRRRAEQIATRFQTALRNAEDSDRRLSEGLAKPAQPVRLTGQIHASLASNWLLLRRASSDL
jgi:hypothetical protein